MLWLLMRGWSILIMVSFIIMKMNVVTRMSRWVWGVINGLPQLESYLVADTLRLDDLEGIVLTTDGMFWPSPLDESEGDAQKRVNHMGDLIRQRGLKGYLKALHEEEQADARGERYQHFAKFDDATGIYVQLGTK